ncbi:hypothetical protein BV22DRAFT_1000146 [Leucogyrophana mollusca]|uniref:Uncharacterized protein n=1 Tax=Leucogyrophana mollusca TaxID=85980 RepID=A0ACB8BYM8_9AGAM|nr:hypothetical protein BV22DRAFT_1000146 [Leucogyrophana mollusca]
MEAPHALKSLLQLQLASDSSSVLHLSYVLAHLNQDIFSPSPHLQKWTTRISSLLHSKDPGARWAGLCLAYRTSALSKPTLIECAQTWVGVALPLLSKSEPVPTLKAAIRYLLHVFGAALEVPEFQRHLATPNVPKFSLALISLVEKQSDLELKVLSIRTLATLVPLYPTLHRALAAALTALCLQILNGSAPSATDEELLESASRLYAVLHFTGGKVGAANLWKKSVDETLQFSWTAFLALRTTFPEQNYSASHAGPASDDPLISVPLNLDRLRCGVAALCDLLRTTTNRPVQVPIGPLAAFCVALLSCTTENQRDSHVDAAVRVMEVAATQSIWRAACALVSCLAKTVRYRLAPNLYRIVVIITYHLEQKLPTEQRLWLLQSVHALLTNCPPFHSQIGVTRLVKAILPSITPLLSTQSEVQQSVETNTSQSKKGKKRRREYEGDEVFKLSKGVVCPTKEDGEVAIALQVSLRNSQLTPAIHSLASRVLLSISLTLPIVAPSSISPHPTLHGQLLGKVAEMCVELGRGTTSAMSKSLGLALSGITIDGSDYALTSSMHLQRDTDLLLHPRGPPLVRSLPHIESLSLFRAEESNEELAARTSLGLGAIDELVEEHTAPGAGETNPQPQSPPQSAAAPAAPPAATATVPPPIHFSFSRDEAGAPHDSIPKPVSPHVSPPVVSTSPEPLPSISSTVTHVINSAERSVSTNNAGPSSAAPAVQPQLAPMAVDDDEEEEEMPTIDMDSDSDA